MPTRRRMSASDKVRFARSWSGRSQAEIAELTNRSQATISRIESGKQSIDCDEIALFSQALGVDPQFFVSEILDVSQIFRVD